MLEAFTYRYRGHSAADPEVYREREEVEEWQEKDPIEAFARRCVEAGVLGEREVQEVRDKAERQVVEAVEFADASPEPALDTLYENLYVLDSDAGWYAVDERSPEPHRGEREEEHMPEAARELAEAGAAYAGQPDGPRPNPAEHGDAQEGIEPEVAEEGDDSPVAEEVGGPDGDAADARGAARRDGGGDAPRRGGLRDGRGRRRLPGRLQGDRRAAGGVRRAAGARHADLREHDRRHRSRRGDGAGCGRWSS